MERFCHKYENVNLSSVSFCISCEKPVSEISDWYWYIWCILLKGTKGLSAVYTAGRVSHTAVVLVEIVEWVKARLLLLVCLERVAGLEIGMLHDRDPARPGERDRTPERKQTDDSNRSTAFNRLTHRRTAAFLTIIYR